MSRVAQDWVSRSNVVGIKRLILWELADCHNQKTGRCDPSTRKKRDEPDGRSLCERTGLGNKRLGNLLDELEADGPLIRERRHWKENGWRASDQYHLALDGIEALKADIDADRVYVDDRMTRSLGVGATLRDEQPKVSPETAPRCRNAPPLGVPATPLIREEGTRKEETTTASTVNGSSYVPDKDLSTSTTGGAGAVEEEPFDNHVNQEENPEHDLRSLVAKLETSGPRDETELNGSGKEGGARAGSDLPAEVQDVLAAFPGFDRNDLAAKWRRRLNEDVSDEAMSALRLYCKLCVGTASSHGLKPHEAAARALPPRQGAEGRFFRPLEAVA